MSDELPRAPIGATPDDKVHTLVLDPHEDPSKLVRSAKLADVENPHPIYAVWEITLACDLGCKHCGSRAGPRRSTELTTEQCLDVVHQLHDTGVREVTLIGGEAYLREDWDTIAKEITRLGMVCGMTTGGRNLNQERVDRAVDAGLKTISVSIDGLEETHDAQRGAKGSWRSAVEASRRIAETPIRLATNTQINRLSLPELPGIADLMVEIGSTAWQIQLTVAMGRAADRPELLLQPYELLELFPLLVWLKSNKLVPNGITMFPGNNIGYFGPYEELLRYGGQKGAHWAGCGAGKWCLGLEADGKIKGCPSLPSDEWTGGNFQTDKLEDVVRDSHELKHLGERTRDDLWGYCKTCYYGDICKAGCSWTSYCLFEKAGNNPYCIHRVMDLESKGLRERLVRVKAAPGVPFDNGKFDLIEEPMPPVSEDHVPTLSGVDLSEAIKIRHKRSSVWTREEMKKTLEHV